MGEVSLEKTRQLIPHLHLHLEPEERKRISTGLARHVYTDRDIFFRSHDLAALGRAAVSEEDLKTFLCDLHAEQRAQGVDYVELRLSPRRFLSDGMSWENFFRVSNIVLTGFEAPVIRAILLINRNSPDRFVGQCREQVIDGLPATYVGIDLAGDEVRFPDVSRFREVFELGNSAGLGVTVHAGEFGGVENVWRAIDELGARRIGHGVSAAQSKPLLKRLSADGILVESSISSNIALRAVEGTRAHPCRVFLENSVPICLNADIPIHSGCVIEDEFILAADVLGLQQEEIFEIQNHAFEFSFTGGRLTMPAWPSRLR